MEEKYIEFQYEQCKYYRFFPDSNELKVNHFYYESKLNHYCSKIDISRSMWTRLIPDVWEDCSPTEEKLIKSSLEFKEAIRKYKIKQWKKNI